MPRVSLVTFDREPPPHVPPPEIIRPHSRKIGVQPLDPPDSSSFFCDRETYEGLVDWSKSMYGWSILAPQYGRFNHRPKLMVRKSSFSYRSTGPFSKSRWHNSHANCIHLMQKYIAWIVHIHTHFIRTFNTYMSTSCQDTNFRASPPISLLAIWATFKSRMTHDILLAWLDYNRRDPHIGFL